MDLSRRSFLKVLSALPAVTLIETLPTFATESTARNSELSSSKNSEHFDKKFVLEFVGGPALWLMQFSQKPEYDPFQLPRGRSETEDEFYDRTMIELTTKFHTSMCACNECMVKTYDYLRQWIYDLMSGHTNSNHRRSAILKYRENEKSALIPFGAIDGVLPISYSIELLRTLPSLDVELSYSHFNLSKSFAENSYGT